MTPRNPTHTEPSAATQYDDDGEEEEATVIIIMYSYLAAELLGFFSSSFPGLLLLRLFLVCLLSSFVSAVRVESDSPLSVPVTSFCMATSFDRPLR